MSVYIGRFAPSPSGPLHMGSLVCALASFLDARAHNGQWLVRIEDIDPPREVEGASDAILRCLQIHGLKYDQPPLFQSGQSVLYYTKLNELNQQGLSYHCQCTRKILRAGGPRYNGLCRTKQLNAGAIRLNTQAFQELGHNHLLTFTDRFCGDQHCDLTEKGDFIIHRKDGLFAYQLAVVVDDIAQKITHVVRGEDLLSSTPYQLALFKSLAAEPPQYGHIPIVLNQDGHKLSKQRGDPGLNETTPYSNLLQALGHMGFEPPKDFFNPLASNLFASNVSLEDNSYKIDRLLSWATAAWSHRHLN